MSANTAIEWADHTFNPWEGCQKVGPGCDNCYAEARNARFGGGTAPNWGTGAPRRRTSPHNWAQPLRWNRDAVKTGARQRVFCASLADVFDKDVPAAWRTDLWDLIEATPGLDWLLLTKRVGNAPRMLPASWVRAPRANVWLGATIVNQEEADRDIPKLLAVPAAKRFLSMEPLLGPVDLTDLVQKLGPGEHHFSALECDVDAEDDEWNGATVDWVIVGGESGPGARPMHPDWVRSLRDQCAATGTPYLFKQWGEWRPPAAGEEFDTSLGRAQRVPAFIVAPEGTVHCFENERTCGGGTVMRQVGKKSAGRLLDGIEHNDYPERQP